MKKIIAYTAVLAALMAVSCSRMEENNLAADLQSSVITLNLNTTEMVATRSDIPAVESVVSQFDWFFYPDATGTSAPVYHGHATVGESGLSFSGTNTPDASAVDEDGYHIGFNVETNYSNLKGNYYVYVLANYAGIDHSASDLTLATLLAKTMETNWDEKAEGYEAINDFVMDSYSGNDEATYPQLVPLSAAVDDDGDGKANLAVDLQRVAAKISFTLNIAKEIVDDAELGTKWRPLINSANFTTYLVNALTYAKVEGKALPANGDLATAHQLSYATSHVKTNKTETTSTTYIWEVDPFYTYPVEFDPASNNAPYFKLALPWENVDSNGNLTGKGSTLFYYKAYLREAKGENETKGKALTKYERNKHYIVTLNVDVLGGTPEDYTILDTFYYVADWQSPADGTYDGYFAPRYLDIARDVYYLYGDNSITVAVTSSHPIKAEIVGTPSQIDVNNNQRIRSISDQGNGAYNLSIRQIWYTDNNNHPSNTANATTTANVTSDGRVSFTLTYQMNTSIATHLMDLNPITWNLKVHHTDDDTVFDTVTIIQYPSIYLSLNHTDADASTFLDARAFPNPDAQTVVRARSGNNGTQRNGNYLGALGGGSPTSRDKTVFTVSTLSSMIGGSFDGMLIGDPRVAFSSLSAADLTHQGLTWGSNDLGRYDEGDFTKYLVASPTKTNFIAPRFMFASGHLGSNANNSNWEQGGNWRTAAERCAAYQEDGYPAGRWRLPTEAEVSFCRQIQANGYIYGLYYPSNPYWTADGRIFQGTSAHTPGSQETASVRCVYDLWYWGEESYDASGKKIPNGSDGNPTSSPATVWLGYMTE